MVTTLQEILNEREMNDKLHPQNAICLYPACGHRVNRTWDNWVLCLYHQLLFLNWFHEEGGWKYCPKFFDLDTGKKLPSEENADKTMDAYRQRYIAWMQTLSSAKQDEIVIR